MEELILSKGLLSVIGGGILAFLITYISTPSIVEVARRKHLYDEPNGRTSHTEITPTLGGLSIFIGFVISSTIFVDIKEIPFVQQVMAGVLILFFLGLKDDIIGLSPSKKLVGQIIAAAIVIDFGKISLHNFFGLAGIEHLSGFSGDLFTMFVIVALINGINLIDGVDGLASGVSIVVAATFGTWFCLVGKPMIAVIAATLIGSLIAFFYYNVYSKKYKLFMGDTGSLVLGFLLSIFAIEFINFNTETSVIQSKYYIAAAPAVAVGILIVPIFDTIRVMTIRLSKGLSPFRPDKRHIHHYILELTGSHKKTTFIIIGANIFFIILSFALSFMDVLALGVILFVLAGLLSYIPYLLLKNRRKKNMPVKEKAFTAETD